MKENGGFRFLCAREEGILEYKITFRAILCLSRVCVALGRL